MKQEFGRATPVAEAEKLFEPFWQADGRDGGLGLGLALVHQLAQLHGGTAQIAPAGADGGALVSFRVPAASHPEAQLA